jgi:hypothetical protein
MESIHPYYKELKNDWLFWELTNDGGKRYVDFANALYSHRREDHMDFTDRKKRAVYISFSKKAIEIYQSHIRRKGVNRIAKGVKFAEFSENVDRSGATLDEFFIEDVFPTTQVFGHAFVLIDNPSSDIEPVSEYDVSQMGLRPYLTCYNPLAVKNWHYQNGKFTQAIIQETVFHEFSLKQNSQMNKGRFETYYKYWDEYSWELYNENWKLIKEGSHDFGQVPLIIFYNKKDKKKDGIGVSAISTLSELDKKIYNLESLLDEFLYRQCFAQLAIAKNSVKNMKELGTTRAIPMDEDDILPFFLSPPIEPAEFLMKKIEAIKNEQYEEAKIRDTIEPKAESGIAKAYDLHDMNQNISQKSKNMESGENKIYKLLEDYFGENIVVEWPTEFDIRTINEELAEAATIKNINIPSETFTKEYFKGLAQRLIKDEKILRKIFSEIDKYTGFLDENESDGLKGAV